MSILKLPNCSIGLLPCAVPSTTEEFSSIAFGSPCQTAEGCSQLTKASLQVQCLVSVPDHPLTIIYTLPVFQQGSIDAQASSPPMQNIFGSTPQGPHCPSPQVPSELPPRHWAIIPPALVSTQNR